jgi:WD40 repeat protein
LAGRPRQFAFLTGTAILAGLPLQSPNTLDAWDVVQQKRVDSCITQVQESRRFEFSGDGSCLIAIDERAVTLINTATGRELTKIEKPSDVPLAEFSPHLAFSPDRCHVAISVNNHDPTWIIDLHDAQSRRQTEPRVRGLSNRAEMILVELGPVSSRLVDLRSGHQLATLRHPTPVPDLAFSPDSKSLATCCADGSVHLWNVATGEQVTRLSSSVGKGVKVQFSADSRKLAAVIALEAHSDPTGNQCTAKVLVWNGLDQGKSQ